MKFLEIQFKNSNRRWISKQFTDDPQKHIPGWYRKNCHTIYVVNLNTRKRKKIVKHYNLIRLIKHQIKCLNRNFKLIKGEIF